MAKGYCCLPLKANKYSLSENKENRGFSDSIMWGPVHNIKMNRNNFRRVCCFDETSPGVFHGHVRIWDELTNTMKGSLI